MLPKSIRPLKHYVNDFSWVLQESNRISLDKTFSQFDTNSNTQVVTVLFPHRKWQSLKDIGVEIFNSAKIGQKWKNNGLLLIISTDEKKIRIIVWKWLEWTYTNDWCRKIIEWKLRPLLLKWEYKKIIALWAQETSIKKTMVRNSLSRKKTSAGADFAMIFSSVMLIFPIPFLLVEVFGFYIFLICYLVLIIISLSSIQKFKKPSGKEILIIWILILAIPIWKVIHSEKVFCENNVKICEERKSSSSSSYESSSRSDWDNDSSSSSSSFDWWWGSTNGAWWWD